METAPEDPVKWLDDFDDLVGKVLLMEKILKHVRAQNGDACLCFAGYITQEVFGCKTCYTDEQVGFCIGCFLACHDDHEVFELHQKRNFRCDCGSTGPQSCQIRRSVAPEKSPDNKYNHNFMDRYCTCNQGENDFDSMVQCKMCEDWFHDKCLYQPAETHPGSFLTEHWSKGRDLPDGLFDWSSMNPAALNADDFEDVPYDPALIHPAFIVTEDEEAPQAVDRFNVEIIHPAYNEEEFYYICAACATTPAFRFLRPYADGQISSPVSSSPSLEATITESLQNSKRSLKRKFEESESKSRNEENGNHVVCIRPNSSIDSDSKSMPRDESKGLYVEGWTCRCPTCSSAFRENGLSWVHEKTPISLYDISLSREEKDFWGIVIQKLMQQYDANAVLSGITSFNYWAGQVVDALRTQMVFSCVTTVTDQMIAQALQDVASRHPDSHHSVSE